MHVNRGANIYFYRIYSFIVFIVINIAFIHLKTITQCVPAPLADNRF